MGNDDGQCDVPDVGGKSCRYAAAGGAHTVLVMEDGAVNAFGLNDDGQCDVPDLGGKSCRYAAAGSKHTVLVMEDGTVKAFGFNDDGQCNVPVVPVLAEHAKMKLGDLCREALKMGIEIDIVLDALNGDVPNREVSRVMTKHKIEAELDPTSCSSLACQSAKELEAVLEYAADDTNADSGIYFFIPKGDLIALPEGRMPSFQDLVRASKLRAFRIEAKWLRLPKKLRQRFIIVSHRWKKQHNPDPDGEQLAELQQKAREVDCMGEWFWLDFMSLPQDVKNPKGDVTNPKSAIEKKYFSKSLQNVNLLYLGGHVMILFDRDYNKRFWCLLEAYLSMRQASASGLTSSQHDPHHTILCMGTTAALAEKHAGMLMLEMEKPLNEMLDWLRSDDVDITNESDKDLMILRMSRFEPIVKSLWA